MLKQFPNYIDGEWAMASSFSPNRNPSDLSDVIGEYAMADVAQAKNAIAAAKAAFPAWSTGGIQDRANILDKVGSDILARKDEIGRLLAREEGKTLPEGVGETVRAGHIFKFFAGEVLRLAGEKLTSVRPGVDGAGTREPRGGLRPTPPRGGEPSVVLQAGAVDARLRVGSDGDPGQRRYSQGRLQPGDGIGVGRWR